MSNNPGTMLARPRLKFCLAAHPKNSDLICTRIDQHRGHCCDEITAESWDSRAAAVACRADHDHSKEKGLAAQ